MKCKKKLLICAIALLLSPLFFSCKTELNPAGGINIVLWGHVYDDTSAPKKNVRVTSNYGYTYTDDSGYFEILCFYYPNNKKVNLSFSDSNGEFKEIKEKDFSISENLEIKLEKK